MPNSRFIITIAMLLLTTGAAATTVTFFDGDFADPDWQSSKYQDSTGGGATFAASHIPIGGNPDAYRQTTHNFGPGTISVQHLSTGSVYDPMSSGAIQSIDYSYDLRHFEAPPSQAVRYRLAIMQSGTLYGNLGDLIFDDVWTSFGMVGLVADDFFLASGPGPSKPDFSATGAPITFGYISNNTNSGGAPLLTRISGIDNWSVTIHVVPIPAAAWLMLSALVGLSTLARRR